MIYLLMSRWKRVKEDSKMPIYVKKICFQLELTGYQLQQ